MQICDKQYGQHVPGTHLTRHGNAPRRSAGDRHQMAWFECELCNENFKAIRIRDVRPDHTVSCGCKGHEAFDRHHTQRAANLPIQTRREIFRLFYAGRKRSLTIWKLADRFNLSKYIIVYVLSAHRALLRTLATAKSALLKLVNGVETWWLDREKQIADLDSYDPDGYDQDRSAYIKSLPWWDRQAYLAEENRRHRAAMERMSPEDWYEILHNPTAEIEFGPGGPFIPIELRYS